MQAYLEELEAEAEAVKERIASLESGKAETCCGE